MSFPLLYEINTRCWLRDLSDVLNRPVTLADVPDSQFAEWQQLGFTHLWLMGVWTGGRRARDQALHSTGLARAYSEALPGWTEADVGSSPYAVAAYRVPPALGGEEGLNLFRRKLAGYGLKLLLDFVPNHLGLDHPWVSERPELFVQSAEPQPDTFEAETGSGKRFLAFGRDPNCPPWTDTVQLDYRRSETRQAMMELLMQVAGLCDGVRCDMAMLLLNDIFANTWKKYPASGARPNGEFWAEAIQAVRNRRSDFLFLAEVYWGLEPRLQSLGFNYTYDKVLYDTLVAGLPAAVHRHLMAMPSACLEACAHFLENHDEPRIASALTEEPHRAAALVILGLPGMRFLHEGQLQGWRRKLPVQLVRRSDEPGDPAIRAFYEKLLEMLRRSEVGRGQPRLLSAMPAWPSNPTAENMVLVEWRGNQVMDLVVVNLAPHRSQCYAPVNLPEIQSACWHLRDWLGKEQFVRDTEELKTRGLYLDVAGYATQVFRFEPSPAPA